MSPKKPTGRKATGLRWGEGRVTRRGEKWQARWEEDQPDGEARERARTFDSEAEAIEHLREVAKAKRERRYVAQTYMTVDTMVAGYVTRGALRWTTNTTATYGQIARTHIVNRIGRQNVHTMTGGDVQRWVDRLHNDGLSASVIENALHILSGAYKEAMRFGDVGGNPCTGVKPPPRGRNETHTWTADEARRVLHDGDGTPQMRAIYAVALTTGMRPGELRGLQWSDVDLDRMVVHIRRTMTRDAQFRAAIGDDTKTIGSRRSVVIPESTVNALRVHRADQERRKRSTVGWKDLDMVFDNGKGNWLSQQSWKRHHDAMCDRLGIRRIRLHDIRHTAATLLLERNVHPKVVADILGHSSVTMTLDRYSHVSDTLQRTAVESVESHLRNTTTRSPKAKNRAIPRRNPRSRPRTRDKSGKVES
jgi:integrase